MTGPMFLFVYFAAPVVVECGFCSFLSCLLLRVQYNLLLGCCAIINQFLLLFVKTTQKWSAIFGLMSCRCDLNNLLRWSVGCYLFAFTLLLVVHKFSVLWMSFLFLACHSINGWPLHWGAIASARCNMLLMVQLEVLMLLRLISHLTATMPLSIRMIWLILVMIAKNILATVRHEKAFIKYVATNIIATFLF